MQQEGVDISILNYQSKSQSSVPNRSTEQEEVYTKPKPKKEEPKPKKEEPKSTRRKTKREPETKMKNIYWDAIDDDKIDASVWSNMNDSAVELDYQDLTNYFRAKENVVLATQSLLNSSIRKQNEIVQLITDDKRLRNVSMAIARLKMSTEVLKQAIFRVDDTILNHDMIRILFENAPTAEEVEIVKGFDGNIELLGDVDRFFKELSTIPNLQTRLKCIHIRSTLEAELEEIHQTFDAFYLALKKCCESKQFYSLMELILAIGNYMNGTSARGGLYGFQISFLPRLGDIKSFDNKTTLLEYIYRFMEKERESGGKYKWLITVIDEFSILFPLKGKDFSQLEQDFKRMKDNYELVGRQRNVVKFNQDDRFSTVMNTFYESMRDMMATINQSLENVHKYYNQFLEKYACPKDYKLSAVVDDLSTFFQQFITIQEEITKKRAMEEELKRAKLANERMRAQMQEQKRQQISLKGSDLMDNYQTMRKNQTKQFHTANKDVSMLGTLKSKISYIPHRNEDPFTSLTIRKSGHFKPLSPLIQNTSKDKLLKTGTLLNSPSHRYSFTFSSQDEDDSHSPGFATPPLNDNTLTLTSRERKSLFMPHSPPRRVTRMNRKAYHCLLKKQNY